MIAAMVKVMRVAALLGKEDHPHQGHLMGSLVPGVRRRKALLDISLCSSKAMLPKSLTI